MNRLHTPDLDRTSLLVWPLAVAIGALIWAAVIVAVITLVAR
jgi:hypothetical protein